MIKALNIEKSFGKLKVLKGINFESDKPEVVSIVGTSGAGKTTLLQILGSLDRPDSGEVIIDNTNIFSLNPKELAKFRNQHIGFVFQFHHLLPEFTALENVMLPGMIAQRAHSELKAKAIELLNDLGLSERIEHKPNQLSGGEQQRVAIARAIINNPSIIFADEPSGNLDSATKSEIHNLFFKLRDKYNQTIIIVTHDKDLAQMSDRVLEMKDGIFV